MTRPYSQIPGAEALIERVSKALVLAHPDCQARLTAGQEIGVPAAVTRTLAMGRPVAINGWLRWCAELELDPVTGKRLGKAVPPYEGGDFLWWMWGCGVHLTRVTRGDLSLRDLARQAGISPATASRMEHGEAMSVAAVAAVSRAIDLHPHAYCAPVFVGLVSRGTGTETLPPRGGERGDREGARGEERRRRDREDQSRGGECVARPGGVK
ncbi:helix-turn-helix domain-containing protein [Amorphus orientalis]|uniref:Transcriptional regulator with XRE-family HTH domain n=1 Tax=Amorphus orientalis TaxID=649198 RepID=A0AAE3VML8_9HYPH|nr:helix-turn-helix transcriptional regulator [Amorphus orientalis]MDQ0314822.1 transcriptional regulator with XRE-family HTH domain [Amorphus orientalis]